MKKEIYLNIRISKELHESIKKEAIKRSAKENNLITSSQIIREILEQKLNKK